jgi:hypothetical protein
VVNLKHLPTGESIDHSAGKQELVSHGTTRQQHTSLDISASSVSSISIPKFLFYFTTSALRISTYKNDRYVFIYLLDRLTNIVEQHHVKFVFITNLMHNYFIL